MRIKKERSTWHIFVFESEYNQIVVSYCQFLKNSFGFQAFGWDGANWRFSDPAIVLLMQDKFPELIVTNFNDDRQLLYHSSQYHYIVIEDENEEINEEYNKLLEDDASIDWKDKVCDLVDQGKILIFLYKIFGFGVFRARSSLTTLRVGTTRLFAGYQKIGFF